MKRLITLLFAAIAATASGDEGALKFVSGEAERGYRHLIDTPYLPPDFDQETFDQVWKVWPEPLRTEAEKADLQTRRKLAFARYGLTARPGDHSGKPLQYVVNDAGQWTMNCFACHGGQVLGQVVPGLPNSEFALQTLTEDIRKTKLEIGKPLSRMDLGSTLMPLGTARGVTNAVIFGVALMAFREPDLSLSQNPIVPEMIHHDMDPPPWWHFKKREMIYIDGFAAKNARALMQFMLVRENGADRFHAWESDYEDVYAFLESIQPPKHPFPVDQELASRGRTAFERSCARCHGTYGEQAAYPGKLVPIDEIGTDRVRLDALTVEHRRKYGQSWFARMGAEPMVEDPGGYVAPPLDGIWASAPYFHNGSVPTLWHVLHPHERPKIWRRVAGEFDREKVGFAVETFTRLPPQALSSLQELREYYVTRHSGKSAAGHRFPEELDEVEKRAVLEYLKTL